MSHISATGNRIPRPSKFLKVLMWILFVTLLMGLYGDWILYGLGWLHPLWRTPIVGGVVSLPLNIVTIFPATVFYAGQTPFFVLCVLAWPYAYFFGLFHNGAGSREQSRLCHWFCS